MDGIAAGREVAAANQAAQSGIIPCTLMILCCIRERPVESYAVASLTFGAFQQRPYQSGAHSTQFPLSLKLMLGSPNVLAHAMICGRYWGVAIYFIKAFYYTPMACGEQHTVVWSPGRLRIKRRTWHWNRNLTAVSSGNLDLDLNSNKVLFFFTA